MEVAVGENAEGEHLVEQSETVAAPVAAGAAGSEGRNESATVRDAGRAGRAEDTRRAMDAVVPGPAEPGGSSAADLGSECAQNAGDAKNSDRMKTQRQLQCCHDPRSGKGQKGLLLFQQVQRLLSWTPVGFCAKNPSFATSCN